MSDGVVLERYQGTPQGGPLSPLLANVLLDEVDKVLERHGHCFVRYADDCNVYVRSRKAGERVTVPLKKCYVSHDLNFSKRPVRTRMPGGVGGARSGKLTVPIPMMPSRFLHPSVKGFSSCYLNPKEGLLLTVR